VYVQAVITKENKNDMGCVDSAFEVIVVSLQSDTMSEDGMLNCL